jgi:hypothetical protein
MLSSLHVAYGDLARTQIELERRMAEIDQTRELFERVIASMSEALFLMDVTERLSGQGDKPLVEGIKETVCSGDVVFRDVKPDLTLLGKSGNHPHWGVCSGLRSLNAALATEHPF